MSYLARRFLRSVLLLAGVSALCFLFTEMAPGSFFDEMRENPQISPDTIARLRAQYGLDQPLPIRYAHWMKSALHADLGYSIAYNTPVAPLLWSRAKNTLLLTITALLFTWLISVPVGLFAAARRGGVLDRAIAPPHFTSHRRAGDRHRPGIAGRRRPLAPRARRRNGLTSLRRTLQLEKTCRHRRTLETAPADPRPVRERHHCPPHSR